MIVSSSEILTVAMKVRSEKGKMEIYILPTHKLEQEAMIINSQCVVDSEMKDKVIMWCLPKMRAGKVMFNVKTRGA